MSYSGKDIQEQLNKHGYNLNIDGIVGPKTTAAIKDFQTKNGLQVDGIVGTNTWGALTKAQTPKATTPAQTETKAPTYTYEAYKPSDAVTQAEALLQQQLAQKPGAYSSAWQTQLDDTLNKILNREKFSYDLNGDALYQQYKDQYTTQGKLAMMDTMGQAAAMTGGYGNSYSQSVGQQAYQGYLQQLNDRVPELYQLALDQYNQEGQDLYNQYGLYADRDAQDYGRYRDSVSDYNAELARLAEDARYKDSTEYGRWSDQTSLDYGIHRDSVADDQWKKTFDEGIRQFDASQASKQSVSTEDTKKYKSLDVGSTAYNTILADIDGVETYKDLLALTKRYIALGYDPDEINALTADKAEKLKPKTPSPKGNSGGSFMSGGIGGRFIENSMI
jgi:peptidoglycan hydrolase-like protein with peptidoglycan-binding domain